VIRADREKEWECSFRKGTGEDADLSEVMGEVIGRDGVWIAEFRQA
jgi:hypothetical protein